jgi:hypothetical protein
MGKIDFGKIDKLRNPQRIVSATFDSEYVTFFNPERTVDDPEIVARIDCIQGLLKWVDDETTKVYGFDCKTDNKANVIHAYLTGDHVVLDFVGRNQVMRHKFLSIDSLRKLVKKIVDEAEK